MRDIIINLRKSDTWKIQLTIAINFISSKDVDEERVIQSKGNNIKCHMIMQMKLLMNFLSHFFQDTKLVQKDQCKGVSLFSTQFIFWIVNVTR